MQSNKIFRVFVSSTFSDLKAERNALQEKVFPKLRKLCEEHGCRFQAIDLRWGVSEEAALDQQAMRICLEEVDRCQKLSPRPNFIVLLGDRYGWQPLPYEIPATEYEAITALIKTEQKRQIEQWYRLDDNAVPAVYCLLPREGEYEDFAAWELLEKKLLAILRSGVQKTELSDDARVMYWSSATEQEIYKGALNASGAKKHVFCFLRQISGLPQNNTAKDFIDLNDTWRQDTEAHERLVTLKERLRNELPGNVHEYTNCEWTGNGISNTHIDQLCDDVYVELSGIIKQELATLQEIDSLEQEIADHTAFAKERAHNFTGRAEIQEKMLDYIKSDAHSPLAIYGEGGSGKSALMAQIFQRITGGHPNAVVVSRFIGATPSSSNIFLLLESLCKQIAGNYGADVTTPTEYKELVEDFKKKLELATEEKPLIIMFDALDQLSEAENAKSLQWLPIELPDHVKVIVSVLEPSEHCGQLKRRLSEELISIGWMEQQEGEALLDLWLKEAKRTLQETQKQEVLNKFKQCGVPLYLKIAFEEARQWKSYTPGEITGSDIQGIILEFLGNLSEESRHGAEMVKHALGYLAAGKNGLTEEEMLDLLSLDQEVKEAFWKRSPNSPKTNRLPVVVWSRLYLDLKPYLTERIADKTTVMTFFHRQFGEGVRNNYLDAKTNKELHRLMAGYFGSQPYQYVSAGKKVPHYRKASELAYQLMKGEMWEELEKTITDFDFPMAKCTAWMVDELVEDYQKANASPVPDKKAMKIWAAFFRERAHILRRGNDEWPAYKILLQLAIEHADDSPLTQEAEKYIEDGKGDWVWLQLEERVAHAGIDPCTAVLEGHTNLVEGALELPDGRVLSWSCDKTLRLWDKAGQPIVVLEGHTDEVIGALVLADGRILSWSKDKNLRLWDKAGQPIVVLEGHTDEVIGALVLADGRILSWSKDKNLRLWDKAGQPIVVLGGHIGKIGGAVVLADGRILSWSDDTTLRLWDKAGQPIVVLGGHIGKIGGAVVLADGRILSWSDDTTLRLWDQGGQPIVVLEGHNNMVEGAVELPDGRILSWSWDETLRLWDGAGQPLSVLEGHTRFVRGAVVLADGRILSWSLDKSLRLWDQGGQPIAVHKGHADWVKGATELADRRILSWSLDATLRLWDKDGQPLTMPGGHTDWIQGVLELADGRILSWSDDTTLMLWNQGGQPIAVLGGHIDKVVGAVVLADGRILSWSLDATLRLWDKDGQSLTVLDGHTAEVGGVLELTDGRILSWSWDATLRLWDQGGQSIAVFEGHTDWVQGVLELTDGRILSWSDDTTLRLWDQGGQSIAVLEGHTDEVTGAVVLADGRILSWSKDTTLRLWGQGGQPISVLKGHTRVVKGVVELTDGRILSWSWDNTLRLWDHGEQPFAVLDGHTGSVEGALELADGRILSWDRFDLRLWDRNGGPLEVYWILEDVQSYPEAKRLYYGSNCVYESTGLIGERNCAVLEYKNGLSIASWHGTSDCKARLLKSDGRAVVTQANGQVCFLKLYDGNRRIGLDELEKKIAPGG
jgi:WD40 repeat protein